MDTTITKKASGQRIAGQMFTLSTEHPDRVGDVIMASGWDLASFRKNPIALYQHDHGSPVGVWKDVRVDQNALVGTLELAAAGTSPLIDTVRSLVSQGIIKAVSVGFRALESKPVAPGSYARVFQKAELLEVSLVSVPANPHAVAIAKSFGMTEDQIAHVFAAPSEGGKFRSGNSAEVIHRAKLAIIAAKRSALC
jgi:HK97 family phage prohead protease